MWRVALCVTFGANQYATFSSKAAAINFSLMRSSMMLRSLPAVVDELDAEVPLDVPVSFMCDEIASVFDFGQVDPDDAVESMGLAELSELVKPSQLIAQIDIAAVENAIEKTAVEAAAPIVNTFDNLLGCADETIGDLNEAYDNAGANIFTQVFASFPTTPSGAGAGCKRKLTYADWDRRLRLTRPPQRARPLVSARSGRGRAPPKKSTAPKALAAPAAPAAHSCLAHPPLLALPVYVPRVV